MKRGIFNYSLNLFIVLFLLVLAGSFCSASFASAEETTILPGGNNYTGDCSNGCGSGTDTATMACKQKCGDYQANDFLLLGVKITTLILGVVGALAFAAFIAGGVMFLASGGSSKMIERGKATILGAVIGLVVVFASYTIVSFVTKDVLGIKDDIFKTGWFK